MSFYVTIVESAILTPKFFPLRKVFAVMKKFKKKFNLKEKISYSFDLLLSKNSFAMIALLFSVMTVAVLIIGTLAFFFSDDGGWLYQIWTSLMHTIDTGTLAEDAISNIPYLITMSLATLCGLLLTSVLIGIITTGFESKLESMKKGSSVVQVSEQTTIIGFNNNIYSLLNELIEANKSKKRAYIVVLGEAPKEEMENSITAHIPNTYTTRIICRSGRLHQAHALALCAAEKSQSIIVNTTDDAETIRILLSLANYVKTKTLYNNDLHYVASIQDESHIEAARIASENKAIIVHTSDAISRIIVNTCRQHGLSRVLTELFNFDGDEMYAERVPELDGKTFCEATTHFKNATLIGLISNGKGILNPPMDTVITSEDKLVLIANDDGVYEVCEPEFSGEEAIENCTYSEDNSKNDLVILGSNNKLPTILREYDKYVSCDTKIIIVDEEIDEEIISDYENLSVKILNEHVNKKFLEKLIQGGAKNILLLNDDSQNTEKSDADTLVNLLLLRDISVRTNKKISITTEMHHAENQKLAACAHVDDFVIGSDFSSLIMAQISECNALSPIIDDLLDETGSELYIKPASNYVKPNTPVNLFTLSKSAAKKGEIFIGYRLSKDDIKDVKINPPKDSIVVFEENDHVIVIADN